jgi:hypothetical protein
MFMCTILFGTMPIGAMAVGAEPAVVEALAVMDDGTNLQTYSLPQDFIPANIDYLAVGFNMDMDEASVEQPGSITLKEMEFQTPVSGTVTYMCDCTENPISGIIYWAHFHPDAPLMPNRDYSLAVSTAVQTVDGTALPESYSVYVGTDVLKITTTNLAEATIGVAYSQTIATVGGVGAIAYSLDNQTLLPPGLELNPTTGEISGIPVQSGSFTFDIKAIDAALPDFPAVQTYTLLINEGPVPVQILIVTPYPVPSDYPDNFVMTIYENPIANLWSSDDQDDLIVEFYSLKYNSAAVPQKILIKQYASNELTIGTSETAQLDTLQFVLPDNLRPGNYKAVILKNAVPVAESMVFIETKTFAVHPEYIFSANSQGFQINLDEELQNVWTNAEENLSVQINKEIYDSEEGFSLEPVGAKFALPADRVKENHIPLPLPVALDAGFYQIDLFRDGKLIASSFSFEVANFNVGINPDNLMEDYPADQQITLFDPHDLDLWETDTALGLDIFKITYTMGGGGGAAVAGAGPGATMTGEETLITSIAQANLTITDDEISFILPPGLEAGDYCIRIKQNPDSEPIVLGEATLGIFPASVRLDINPFKVYAGDSVTVTLYEPVNQSFLWNDGEALQLELYMHIPQTPWTPKNFVLYTTDFAYVAVSKDQINFTLPSSLTPGQYLLAVNRGDQRIAYSKLQVNPPLLQLQADPMNVLTGYKGQKAVNVTDPSGDSCPWNEQDNVFIRLLTWNAYDDGWIDLGEIPARDITQSGLNAMLPEGLPEGNYILSINQYDVEIAYAEVYVQRLYLNASPMSFMAANPQPCDVMLSPTPGGPFMNVNWSTRDMLSYRLYKYNMTNQTVADRQDTGISGAVDQLSGYRLNLQLPAGMEEGSYGIAIENNGTELAFAPIMVAPGFSQVNVGTCLGFKSSTVTVPVYGVYAQGAAGAQFQLEFDPLMLSVVGSPDTDIWNITISNGLSGSYAVHNDVGTVNIALSVQDGSEISEDIIQLCEIEFAVSGDALPFVPINIVPLEGSLLSDGLNEIPAVPIPGMIKLVGRGDVNENNRIDVGDAILLLRHYAGLNILSPDRQKIGDVDGVAGISLDDAICVLERVVNKISQFPVDDSLR